MRRALACGLTVAIGLAVWSVGGRAADSEGQWPAYSGDKAISHYEVVVGYEPEKRQVLLLDPGKGWQTNSFKGFAEEWAATKAVTVVTFPRGETAATAAASGG